MDWKEFEEFRIEAHGLRMQVEVESGEEEGKVGWVQKRLLISPAFDNVNHVISLQRKER